MQPISLTHLVFSFTLCLPLLAQTLPQEAYVWQREWLGAVRESITAHADQLTGITCLAAEITPNLTGDRVVMIPLDWDMLGALQTPITLAIRVGAYPGPFGIKNQSTQTLLSVVDTVLKNARQNSLYVTAIEIDFDCATSKLAGYRNWLIQLRGILGDTPLSITTLPTWMSEPDDFAKLVQAADHYVLQAHSIQRPKNLGEDIKLCDAKQTLNWIARANDFNQPFHVALPTYGYELAFDSSGTLMEVRAEDASPVRNATWRYEELRADPVSMASIVHELNSDRPAHCKGIIWYRLPIRGERLNWDAATWLAVMQGKASLPNWQAKAVSQADGVIEIQIQNTGVTSAAPPATVTANWSTKEAVAWDGQRHYSVESSSKDSLTWHRTTSNEPLRPQEIWTIGWVRIDQPTKLELTVIP